MRDISSEADIKQLVDSFYQKVQKNEALNHVFNHVAKIDWDHHLPKMYAFWSSIIFGSASYKGNPMEVHKNLHAHFPLTKELFDDWLALFLENLDTQFTGENALKASNSARSIAMVLQTKTVFASKG